MKKVVKLTESDLSRIVKKVLNETHEKNNDRYMFFSNLEDGIAYANTKPNNVAIYEIKVGKAYDMSKFGIPIYIKPKDFTFETNG